MSAEMSCTQTMISRGGQRATCCPKLFQKFFAEAFFGERCDEFLVSEQRNITSQNENYVEMQMKFGKAPLMLNCVMSS